MEAKALKFHQISNVFGLEEVLWLHVGFEKIHSALAGLAAMRAVAESRQVVRRTHLVVRGGKRISGRSRARMFA